MTAKTSSRPEINIIIFVLILVALGVLQIYAASSMKATQQFGDSMFFVRKQFFATFVGLAAALVIYWTPLKWIQRVALPLFLVTTLLLSLILIPDLYHKVGGAKRWLNLAGMTFQPVEMAKVALVLYLARCLSRPSSQMARFSSGVLPALLPIAVFAPFIMLQPDFGSTVLLVAITILMLFLAGLGWRYLIAGGISGILAVALAILIAPYRLARLTTFLDPYAHAKEGGFQIIQSYLAFQNGGFFGVGLGESKQKLFFLPEAHTDFILPVIGEELGFWGVASVWGAFVGLTVMGYKIATTAQNHYHKFLALGVTGALSLQGLINMGVTMGLLPTKGIPLPFVSSGRSSLICSMLLVGLLLRVAREVHEEQEQQQFSNAPT